MKDIAFGKSNYAEWLDLVEHTLIPLFELSGEYGDPGLFEDGQAAERADLKLLSSLIERLEEFSGRFNAGDEDVDERTAFRIIRMQKLSGALSKSAFARFMAGSDAPELDDEARAEMSEKPAFAQCLELWDSLNELDEAEWEEYEEETAPKTGADTPEAEAELVLTEPENEVVTGPAVAELAAEDPAAEPETMGSEPEPVIAEAEPEHEIMEPAVEEHSAEDLITEPESEPYAWEPAAEGPADTPETDPAPAEPEEEPLNTESGEEPLSAEHEAEPSAPTPDAPLDTLEQIAGSNAVSPGAQSLAAEGYALLMEALTRSREEGRAEAESAFEKKIVALENAASAAGSDLEESRERLGEAMSLAESLRAELNELRVSEKEARQAQFDAETVSEASIIARINGENELARRTEAFERENAELKAALENRDAEFEARAAKLREEYEEQLKYRRESEKALIARIDELNAEIEHGSELREELEQRIRKVSADTSELQSIAASDLAMADIKSKKADEISARAHEMMAEAQEIVSKAREAASRAEARAAEAERKTEAALAQYEKEKKARLKAEEKYKEGTISSYLAERFSGKSRFEDGDAGAGAAEGGQAEGPEGER